MLFVGEPCSAYKVSVIHESRIFIVIFIAINGINSDYEWSDNVDMKILMAGKLGEGYFW